jgi:hypothetical protein
MHFQKILTTILICCSAVGLMAQTNDNKPPKKRRFAFYAGVGPNYYFNNLVIGKNLVNELNFSAVGRFMWEPEHLLSIGIESGYVRLYTMDANGPGHAHIVNSAIPIQLVISMKFLKSFYFNFTLGQSKLLNKVTSDSSGDFNTSAWSLADFGGTVGYKYKLKNRISVGAEAKYFYSTGFIDRNIALVFMIGYRF